MSDNVSDLVETSDFKIGHFQAPTGESSRNHPARYMNSFLWHNGLVKSFDIQRMQELSDTDETWDTSLILQNIVDCGWETLSDINGSFACFFLERRLTVFRNEISPMFFDSNMNFSSVKFKGSSALPPNKVFEIDLISRKLKENPHEFTTRENPYYL